MIETTNETVNSEVVEAVKPYAFRQLSSTHLFLITKIIKKIGIKEFKSCFSDGGVKSLVQNAVISAKEAGEDVDYIEVGIGVALDIADVLLGNLHLCENDIYRLLAQTSNLTVEEITAPGNAVLFVEMLVDFVKKEEFKDFFRVASTLF